MWATRCGTAFSSTLQQPSRNNQNAKARIHNVSAPVLVGSGLQDRSLSHGIPEEVPWQGFG